MAPRADATSAAFGGAAAGGGDGGGSAASRGIIVTRQATERAIPRVTLLLRSIWVQCDARGCGKWRRISPDVLLGKTWQCAQMYRGARCTLAQEPYDDPDGADDGRNNLSRKRKR